MAKESVLSASLRAGAFDTNVSTLRTCSLPDLRSLFSASPQEPSYAAKAEAVPSNQDVNEGGNEQEEEEGSEDEDEGEPVSKFKEDSEEEESQRDDALREESEEGSWSSSDDEDIHQLVQTLQSYVEESSRSLYLDNVHIQ